MSKVTSQKPLVSDQILNGWQTLISQLADFANVSPAMITLGPPISHHICSCSNSRSLADNRASKESRAKTASRQPARLSLPEEPSHMAWFASGDTKRPGTNYVPSADLTLCWPDGETFGTICLPELSRLPELSGQTGLSAVKLLPDDKQSPDNATLAHNHYLQLLSGLRRTIETHLHSLWQQHSLQRENEELQTRLQSRTQDLAALNYSLNQEIDKRQAAEQLLEHQHLHDAGTGFFNQQGLENQLERRLAADINAEIAVLHLGFANGRHLQARFGYQAWEQILRLYARHIESEPELNLTIARTSATDLVLLISSSQLSYHLNTLCHQLLNLHQSEWEWQQQRFHLHAYVGIATSLDSRDVHALLEHAHGAMLVCKDSGYGFHYHSSATEQTFSPGNAFSGSLQQALQGDEIVMLFAPKVQPKSRLWVGAQPQLRWKHPQLGDIRHDSLMLIAKQNGLGAELGNFILRQAIETASRWYRQFSQLTIAIPLSAEQMENGQLAWQIEALLNAHDLSAIHIELEIPERALLGDEVTLRNTLSSLHDMGIHLTLSEFGSGPTSFHQLKMLPFDGIKLDKHFMRQLASDRGDPSTLRSVIHIAKKLGLQIALEGIDHPAQEAFFSAEGCDVAQGSLYAQPLSAEEFELVMFNQRESIAK